MNSIKDKIQKEILENGLQVWHCNPNNSNNKVSIRLIIGAGTNQVSMAQNALPHLVEHVVFDFLEAGEASKIYYSLKDNNGYINANTNYDITTFVADIKEAQINTVIDLIKLFLINPNLHKENIDKEKDIVLNEIENNRVHFYYKLFQKSLKRNSLYYSPTGTKTSLKNIEFDDIKEFIDNYYVAQNMILLIVGNIDFTKTLSYVSKQLAGLPKGTIKWPKSIYSVTRNITKQRKLNYTDISGYNKIFGYITCGSQDEDYYKNWFLMRFLQEKIYKYIRNNGLSYNHVVYYTAFKEIGLFYLYIKTSDKKAKKIISKFQSYIRDISKNGISELEFVTSNKLFIKNIEDITKSSSNLADFITTNIYKYINKQTIYNDLEDIKHLKNKDFKDIVSKYFIRKNLFVINKNAVGKVIATIAVYTVVYIVLSFVSLLLYKIIKITFEPGLIMLLVSTNAVFLFFILFFLRAKINAGKYIREIENELAEMKRKV